MKTYLLTGAAGFIGARVGETLLREGHNVIGIDNLNNAYDVRLKEWRLNNLKAFPNFVFYPQDIYDYTALRQICEQHTPIDGIINLAARAGVRSSVEDPWVYLRTNTEGVVNLLECARAYQIPKFVLASTSSLYGNNPPFPTPETAPSDRPLQPYAASKLGAEAMAHAYHYLHGIDCTIFRYFTVYGPAGRPDMVMFRFVQWISEGRVVHLNGDGNQSRGFTYVDDIARGTILGLKPLGYELINLGGHENITINQMIAMLEELIGKKAQIEYHPTHKADAPANYADVLKARSLLGWEPQVSLLEGMRNLVDWYRAERSWASKIVTD